MSTIEIKHGNNQSLEESWEGKEPAPLEYFHDELLEGFHKWRLERTENTTVEINGLEFNKIVAAAKKQTYAKYPKQVSRDAVLKTDM